MDTRIKILFIEEEFELRKKIESALTADDNFRLIDSLSSLSKINQYLSSDLYDIILLDIDNLGMDGIDFIRHILNDKPSRLLVIGSLTQKGKYNTLLALESGAVDFVHKPPTDLAKGWDQMISDIKTKLLNSSSANLQFFKNFKLPVTKHQKTTPKMKQQDLPNKICLFGGGAGSIIILRNFLTQIPKNFPGSVIITNLPEGFTKTFADKMDVISQATIKEAENNEIISPGKLLIAPANIHIKIIKSNANYHTILENGEKINGHRPSIDVLLHSAVDQSGKDTIALLLSGCNSDGIHGLLELRREGANTFTLTPETTLFEKLSVSAIELGAVEKQIPSTQISEFLEEYY